MSDRRRKVRALLPRCIPLCLALLCVTGAYGESPRSWLDRMVAANETLNYRGTLVHMCGGIVDIVQIVHRVDRGQVTERLTAQAAGGRQIIRKANMVMCILPDQKKVVVEQRSAEMSPIGSPIEKFPSFSNISPSLYDVAMLGEDRIAGRQTVVLAITPVDALRYGYRLWLDSETALPLKFELVDNTGQGLEHGVFTEIEFYESIDEQAVAPTIATDGFEWQRSAPMSAGWQVAGGDPSSQQPVRFRVATPPTGFELIFAPSPPADGAPMAMQQLVYSDGLATISVFIEKTVAASAADEGSSQIGATNAYTTTTNGYLITAMGNVPLDTVRGVARSVTTR